MIAIVAGGVILAAGLRYYREALGEAFEERMEALVRSRTEELIKTNRMKDSFVGYLTHEVCNPLNAILGLIREMRPGEVVDEAALNALNAAVDYLNHALREVSELTCAEAGVIEARVEAFRLQELGRGLVDLYGAMAAEKGIVLYHECDEPDDCWVSADLGRLRHAVGNLMHNAIKFTQRGSVCLRSSLVRAGGVGQLLITVKDTGCGVSAEEQEAIFDPYFRSGSLAKQSGVGLGLALVKALVHAMGGVLSMESAAGAGSTFYLRIPLKEPVEPLALAAGCAAYGRLEARILVIEDLPFNRMVLTRMLEQFGCEVMSVESGERGMALALAENWDCILVDWELPGISGLEFTLQLRASLAPWSIPPVIGMSGFNSGTLASEGTAAGMAEFLYKPMRKDVLYAALLRQLDTCDRNASRKAVHSADGNAGNRGGAVRPGIFAGPGVLQDLLGEAPWEQILARWLVQFFACCGELDAAIAEHDCPRIGHCAHRFIGHLCMVEWSLLPDIMRRLMDASQQGQMQRVELCWSAFKESQTAALQALHSWQPAGPELALAAVTTAPLAGAMENQASSMTLGTTS